MQKFKKIVAATLASVIAVTSLTFGSLAALTNTYTFYEGYTKVEDMDTNAITLWAGGGKSTTILKDTGTVDFNISAVTDAKVTTLSLISKADGTEYNVTAAKGINWAIVSTKPTLGSPIPTGDIEAGKIKKNTTATVSKGKVTAGKVAGTVYAVAYTMPSKKEDAKDLSKSTVIAAVKIEVQQAATAINIFAASSASEFKSSDKKVSSVNLNIGANATVLSGLVAVVPNSGADKSTKVLSQVTIGTYSAVLASTDDVVTFDDGSTSATGLSLTELKALALKGTLTSDGKPAKATLTIKSEQSGKAAKLTINTANGYTANPTAGTLAIAAEDKKAASKDVVVAVTGLADEAKAATVKPVLYLVTAKSGTPTADAVAANVLKDGALDETLYAKAGSGYKVALDTKATETNRKFKVTIPKNAEDGTLYAVAVYGTAVYVCTVTVTGVVEDEDEDEDEEVNPDLTALTINDQTVTLNKSAKTGAISATPTVLGFTNDLTIVATVNNSGTAKIVAGTNTTQSTDTVKITSPTAGTPTTFTVDVYKDTTKVATYTITVTIE